jgi:hypothetical protein
MRTWGSRIRRVKTIFDKGMVEKELEFKYLGCVMPDNRRDMGKSLTSEWMMFLRDISAKKYYQKQK